MLVNFDAFRRRKGDPDVDAWRAIVKGGTNRDRGCEHLYFRYASHLKTIFGRAGVSEAQAEELLHDVFIKLIVNCESYTTDQNFRVWLYAIARNTLVDHLRKIVIAEKAMSETHGIGDPSSLPEHAKIESFGLRDCVQQALQEFEQLDPERATILTRFIIEDQSSKLLAHQLGRSDGATREYLRQCRIKLRPFLERCRAFLEGEQ